MSDLSSFIQQQAEYTYEPIKWAYDLLHFEPNSFQEQGLKDYIEHGHCAWSTGSGVGKTTLLAIITLHFLSTRPFPVVPATAPSQHQLNDVLWAEIRRWMRRSSILEKMFEWTQEKIYLKGYKEDWFAVARTSSPRPGSNTVEGLQGFHAENILYLLDEASGVPDQVTGAVDGALSTPNAKIIMASNPTRNTGYFYRATTDERLKALWRVMFVDASKLDAPYINKEYIERLKVIYGEDSDYYRMRVRGLPPRTEFNALISPEQIFAAHQRVLQPSGHKFLSTDVGRFGNDDSVHYLRDGNVIIERIAVHGMDTVQVAETGLEFFEKHDIEEWRIDTIGIGAGTVDYAKKKLGNKRGRVKPVHVGEDANNKEEFFNKRAEIMWNLRTAIDNVSIPIDTPLLDEELVQIRYGWDSKDKRIKLESKDSTKASLGRSPNDADSFGLNCANLKTSNAIAPIEYFKTGATNPLSLSPEQLLSTIHSTDKSARVGLMLRMFSDRHNSVGINRFQQFKEDRSNFQLSQQ